MKKTILTLAALCTFIGTVNAQQKVYVCDGYNYDAYTINDQTDIRLSADKKSITISDNTYLTTDFDSITFAEPQFKRVAIKYNGNTATVSIPSSFVGVTCTSGTSSHVVINSLTDTNEYLYSIEGTSADGSLTINGSYKLSLSLDGVDLTSTKGAAVDIECGKRIDIFVRDGSVNTFKDSANGLQKAAFYTKGHAEFKGAGTLNVTGNTKHAIGAKEYILFKGSLGTVNILSAVSDGIHCGKGEKGDGENNYFKMNGGTVSIKNCKGDCIDSDDFGCVVINGGTLTMDVAQVDGCGIKCDSIFTMTAGDITANITGNISNGIRSCFRADFKGGLYTAAVAGNGARGIRSKLNTKATSTVRNGGNMNFSGTNVKMTVSGGTYTADQSKCFGIKADDTLKQTAGDLTITVKNSAATAIKADEDEWLGGTRNGKKK